MLLDQKNDTLAEMEKANSFLRLVEKPDGDLLWIECAVTKTGRTRVVIDGSENDFTLELQKVFSTMKKAPVIY